MNIIIKDIAPIDWGLAIRAARWLLDRPDADSAILAYGESSDYDKLMHFHAKRNKSSITVRPC